MVRAENEYGSINISSEVIVDIVAKSVEQCYGIVGMTAKSTGEEIAQILHFENYGKGIKLNTIDDKISIDISVVVEYGVSIEAVARVIMDTVSYNLSNLTGIEASKINVYISDVRI